MKRDMSQMNHRMQQQLQQMQQQLYLQNMQQRAVQFDNPEHSSYPAITQYGSKQPVVHQPFSKSTTQYSKNRANYYKKSPATYGSHTPDQSGRSLGRGYESEGEIIQRQVIVNEERRVRKTKDSRKQSNPLQVDLENDARYIDV